MVPTSLVAGRVEIVRMDHARTCSFPGFWMVSFYLKACFAESEIGDLKNGQFLRFWEFRRR